MSRMYVNNYLNSLHQQISTSVDRIKYKSGQTDTDLKPADEGASFARSGYGALDGYAYRLLDTGVSYQLTSLNSEQPPAQDAAYAADSYYQSAQVDRRPTVLIDFMFANNREFDFKV